jgi:hypothetical protein
VYVGYAYTIRFMSFEYSIALANTQRHYGDFGKPDRHVIDIFYGIGISQSRDNYEVLKSMVKMARINDELPAVVDRLLWFIGSGKYVDENVKIARQKAAFIEYLRSKLDAK